MGAHGVLTRLGGGREEYLSELWLCSVLSQRWCFYENQKRFFSANPALLLLALTFPPTSLPDTLLCTRLPVCLPAYTLES